MFGGGGVVGKTEGEAVGEEAGKAGLSAGVGPKGAPEAAGGGEAGTGLVDAARSRAVCGPPRKSRKQRAAPMAAQIARMVSGLVK